MEPNRVFLLPGEFVISKKPHQVSTLLGSCIAVCLYHKKGKFGGINHFMLPSSSSGEKSGKYGDYAIKALISFMRRANGGLNNIEAMIFGGASVVGAIRSAGDIGQKNIALARQVLSSHRIPIIKEHIGGIHGLKIDYQTWSNQVNFRQIEKSQFSQTMLAKDDHFKTNKIKVLVVDDSPLVRNILTQALSGEKDIEVVGQAQDAFEAREMLIERNPDVITLDIIMPKMDGVSFLKRLMVYHPKPVIIVSTIAKNGSKVSYRAGKIGAVDVIDKEKLNLYKGFSDVKSVLIPKIRNAARSIVKKRSKEVIAGI